MTRIAIMVGSRGRGSNMHAIITACQKGQIAGEVVLVIGSSNAAPALERARQSQIPVTVVKPKDYDNDAEYGNALLTVLSENKAELLCMAGYMRILPSNVVKAYYGKCMNIHPALLPFFGGKGMYGENVHKAVIDSGMKVSGCTVHFVDDEYDHGPIIIQKTVPVEDSDSPDTLAARVLAIEHQSYVEAIKLFSEGKLALVGNKVIRR